MVFASGIFLFMFLPVTLIGYWLLRNKSVQTRNLFLLIMSIGFYLESGWKELILLLMSVIVNYIMAFLIAKYNETKLKKVFFIITLIYNIGMLFVFKYLIFVSSQIGQLIPQVKLSMSIALPLGISFYTFQAMSYVIDVYREADMVEHNILNVALYISFFPQLVAGPIVRWDSIRDNLRNPQKGGMNYGLTRFTIGLSKKVLIANQMAVLADKAFELLGQNELSVGFAWIGAVGYMLQIYFDFSGYSDMAIGLGAIFGFKFPENFNYPYISESITEFWRRWHISLSSWFRDYVYIPLGGNRCSRPRMFFNLFVVWMLTGIWHGANYTFWLWGFCYFIFLIIEKQLNLYDRKKNIIIVILRHAYTLLVVLLLWVLFRADNISDAVNYIGIMFTGGASSSYALGVTKLYIKNYIGYIIIAIVGCMPWLKVLNNKMSFNEKAKSVITQVGVVILFILACCVTVDSNYNPFIYFNF